MGIVRDVPPLLRTLGDAGGGTATALVAARLAERAVPVATAVVLGALAGPGSAAAPLAALGAVLIAGHTGEAFAAPLEHRAATRIDGAHRARLARLMASRGLADAADTRVRALLREVRADPEHGVESTPGTGATAAVRWLCGLVGAAAACAVLASFAWWAAPLVLLPAAAHHALRHRRSVGAAGHWRRAIDGELHADVWRRANLSLGEAKEIRVFGLRELVVQRVRAHLARANRPLWDHIDRGVRRRPLAFLLVLCGLAPVYAAVSLDGAPVSVQTAVLAAGWTLWGSLGSFGDLFAVAGAAEVLRSTRELRDLPPVGRPAPRGPAPAPGRTASVRFENVSFTYPRTGRPVLDGLDLEVRTGELLAVVGLNGAGKSTLIRLLCGLYPPGSGRVLVNCAPADLTSPAWTGRVAVVLQGFSRHPLSARENVLVGRPGPEDAAALASAARESGFDGIVAGLPLGWDTPLSRSRTGGVDLSGGQWQRLALTRALYAAHLGADLIVADEPTAHLDVRTEFSVFERLARRGREQGVVLVSHRLSTVRRADRIVLLEGGRVAESGTHDGLVAAGGSYARMFAVQAARFRGEGA